jgi:hypothetical protein
MSRVPQGNPCLAGILQAAGSNAAKKGARPYFIIFHPAFLQPFLIFGREIFHSMNHADVFSYSLTAQPLFAILCFSIILSGEVLEWPNRAAC